MRPLRLSPQRFRRADEGGVIVLFAVLLAIFAGFAALSYDFGRLAATQSELQSFADNVALAAAGELDGRPDAITRAHQAAATLVTDRQTFGEGSEALGGNDFSLKFYAVRPTRIGTVAETTSGSAAKYVAVRVDDRRVVPVFGSIFEALTERDNGREDVGAYAVAGFSRYACNVTPIMICAPSATFDISLNEGATLDLHLAADVGQLAAGAIAPIDPVADLLETTGLCEGLSGIGLDICLIAADGERPVCLADDGVDVASSGLSVRLDAALNIPFDIYDGAAAGLVNDALYPAASNVLSAFEPASGECVASDNVAVGANLALPLDDCQSDGSCGVLGDGDWSNGRTAYIEANLDGVDPDPSAATRYALHLAEIALAQEADPEDGGLVGGLLGGVGDAVDGLADLVSDLVLPSCSSQVSDDPARRVVVAAMVDCGANGVTAGSQDVPVLGFAEVFLMAPVGLDGSDTLAVEILGEVGSRPSENETDAIVRNVVRLYE